MPTLPTKQCLTTVEPSLISKQKPTSLGTITPRSANSICLNAIVKSTNISRNVSTHHLLTTKAVLHFKWLNYYLPPKRWKVKEQLALITSHHHFSSPLVLQELLSILNSSFSLAHCPRVWRVATIIPLLKAGKSPSEVASFCPISLTSCVVKHLERILTDCLYYITKANNLFSWFQASFCKRWGCEDEITRIV